MRMAMRAVLAFLPADLLDAGTDLRRHSAPLPCGGGRTSLLGPALQLVAQARCGGLLLAGLLLAGHCLLLALPGPGVGLCALTVDRKAAAMPDALIATDLDLAADI